LLLLVLMLGVLLLLLLLLLTQRAELVLRAVPWDARLRRLWYYIYIYRSLW